MHWSIRNDRSIDFTSPRIMGILNLTPDSFFDGGKHNTLGIALKKCKQLVNEGADIIDLGATSSRPGSPISDPKQELTRLMPVLQEIRTHFPDILISIDTYHRKVAEKCINNGADIINDISAGDIDPEMIPFIQESHIPYIMMHMQGEPANMQQSPEYKDVVEEVLSYFSTKLALFKKADSCVIIDPGFGFGKTVSHNYSLMNQLERFLTFNQPILVGVSRKSMINKVLNTLPEKALNGTTVLNTIALLKGANILRVHDVKEAAEAIKIVTKLKESE